MFLNIVTSQHPVDLEPRQTGRYGDLPSARQLWNAIESPHRFPELTMHLAVALTAGALPDKLMENSEILADFNFPILAAPDLKAISRSARYKQPVKEEIALPAREEVQPEPQIRPQKRKGSLWAYLLTAVFLFSLLLWFSAEIMLRELDKDIFTQCPEHVYMSARYSIPPALSTGLSCNVSPCEY